MLRKKNLLLAFLLALLLSGVALAQNGDWRRRGGDGDQDRDDSYSNQERREHQRWYQQGLRDGREDREDRRWPSIRRRNWDDQTDRDAYVAGYRAGYGPGYSRWGDNDNDEDDGHGYGYGWHDPDDRWGRGGYGWYGGYDQVRRQAYSVGYQDGLNDGAKDWRTGHSNRPTQGDNYKHADRGYNSSYGNKQAYKDEYRAGYTQGYQRGYNSSGW